MKRYKIFLLIKSHTVSNKAKGRISKWVFQEDKARQILRKTNISYPLIRTHTYQEVSDWNLRWNVWRSTGVFSWTWMDSVWAAQRRYYVDSFAIAGPFTGFYGLLLSYAISCSMRDYIMCEYIGLYTPVVWNSDMWLSEAFECYEKIHPRCTVIKSFHVVCPYSYFISVTCLSVNHFCFLLIFQDFYCRVFFLWFISTFHTFAILIFFSFVFILRSSLHVSLYLSLSISFFLCCPWFVVLSFLSFFLSLFSVFLSFFCFPQSVWALITSVSMAGIASTCSSQTPFEYSYFLLMGDYATLLHSPCLIFSSISPRIARLVSVCSACMIIVEHSFNFLFFLYFLIQP